VGFESTIPAFERAKIFHALASAAIVIGNSKYTYHFVAKYITEKVQKLKVTGKYKTTETKLRI
jgi:hypothetical protein